MRAWSGWTPTGSGRARFVQLGFLHILDGADHLLFLTCLVIPFRRVRPLIPIVTASRWRIRSR